VMVFPQTFMSTGEVNSIMRKFISKYVPCVTTFGYDNDSSRAPPNVLAI